MLLINGIEFASIIFESTSLCIQVEFNVVFYLTPIKFPFRTTELIFFVANLQTSFSN